MTKRHNALEALEHQRAAQRDQIYILRLFVSGASVKSQQAIQDIKMICEEHLPGHYELEVVDVYQQPRLAVAAHVVATPVLVRERPLPLRRFIGRFSNSAQLLHRLGLRT